MKCFCIFEKTNITDDVRVSQIGFSWYAFFFGPLWGLTNRVLDFSIVWIIFILLTQIIAQETIPGNFFTIVLFCSNLFWGFFGRDLKIQKMLDEQYKPKKLVNAKSTNLALAIYLSEKK